jgi:hypothetical protein
VPNTVSHFHLCLIFAGKTRRLPKWSHLLNYTL